MSEQTDDNIKYNFNTNRVINYLQGLELPCLSIGHYVACIYDKDWYIGTIEEVCDEEGDVKVNFMHPKGPGGPQNSFFWPSKKDICFAPKTT